MDACKSKVFASRLSEAYPQAHIVYTKNSEYFHDMPISFQRGLVALANHYTYDEMRRYVASGAAYQGENYLFPDDAGKLAYQDQDGDGVTDAEDRVYDVEPGYDGEAAARSVLIANTYVGYSGAYGAEAEDRYRPGGVFDGEAGGPATRITEREDAYGEERWFVEVSDELLGMDDTERTARVAHDLADHWGGEERWSEEKRDAGAFLVGAAVYDVWGGSGWSDYNRDAYPGWQMSSSDASKYQDEHDFVTSEKLDAFVKDARKRK
jgi:hypothetical protein